MPLGSGSAAAPGPPHKQNNPSSTPPRVEEGEGGGGFTLSQHYPDRHRLQSEHQHEASRIWTNSLALRFWPPPLTLASGLENSMTRKRWILIGALLAVGCATAILWSLSYFPDEDPRYRQLSRARRLSARLTLWQFSPTYRKILAVTKADPARHFSTKADRLESSLRQSGDLVSLTFLVPNLQTRQNQIFQQLMELTRNYPDQVTDLGLYADTVSMLCRPDLVAFVQSTFGCDITNRVPWGELLKLGGSQEESVCRLPDRSIVDLETCYKWLNNSIADGWMVGVTLQNDRPGHSEIVVTRKKAEPEAPTRALSQ